MAITENEVSEISYEGRDLKRGNGEDANHSGYTEQQIEVLERIYTKCTHPNHSQRSQILLQHASLTGIEGRQLKLWFADRGCRKKVTREIESENKRLAEANRLLKQNSDSWPTIITEKNSLQNQVCSFISTTAAADLGCEPQDNFSQPSSGISINNSWNRRFWLPQFILELSLKSCCPLTCLFSST